MFNTLSLFQRIYKVIATSKQQGLDADPKAIQQINFTGNLAPNGNTRMLLIIEEAIEIVSHFPQRTVIVL